VAASCVLVRNKGDVLPLDPAALTSVAVIGANAARARIQGGGSAGVFPEHVVTPLEGIRAALEGHAEVRYAPGVHFNDRPTPLSTADAVNPRTGEPGVLVLLLDVNGTEIHAEHRLSGNIIEPSHQHLPKAASIEIQARFRADVSGDWRLGVAGLGIVTLRVDGKTVFDDDIGSDTDDPTVIHVTPPFRRIAVPLEAGEEVELIARRRFEPGAGHVLALCADPPEVDGETALRAAADLAGSCDAAIVVVGTTDTIESEGFDRTGLALPGRQDDLVAAVAAANPNTVVIVNSGGPVLLPWREQVPAVLLAWFPGQEAGDGLADVLFGASEPGGRMPTTWPQTPESALTTVPTDGVLSYVEGLDVGHRGYLRSGVEPAYWFGHGLGYTDWTYESVACDAPQADGVRVRVRVRNTGRRAGSELVQVYLMRADSAVSRPVRWLAGFARVTADPREEVEAVIDIAPRAFQHWSTSSAQFMTEPGEFTVLVGRSVSDLPLGAITIPCEENGSPP
jgi:beta-glucosidase